MAGVLHQQKFQYCIWILALFNVTMAARFMLGVFENKTLSKNLDQALTTSAIMKWKAVHLKKSFSLIDIVAVAESMQEHDLHVITDMEIVKAAILQESLQNCEVGSKMKKTNYFTSLMHRTQMAKHRCLIEEMMSYLNSRFMLRRALTVILDQSQYSEVSVATITEKCAEAKRIINSVGIISNETSNEEMERLLKGNLIFVDCEGHLAAKLLKVAKKVGYTGYAGGVSWLFSERTTKSLPLSCSLPEGDYVGLMAELGRVTVQGIIENVMKCSEFHWNSCLDMESHCSMLNIRKVTFMHLWTRLEDDVGKSWLPTSHQGIMRYHNKKNPFLPRLRLAVANTFQPWITIVDFDKTDGSEPYCGLYGKYGYRYMNSESNTTIPICAYGLAIDILRYLEDKHEVVGIVHVSRDGHYGGYNATSKKATGLVQEIISGNADFAVDMMEEHSRRKVIEFAKPYEFLHHGIAYIKNQNKLEGGVFGPFDRTLWTGIILVIVGLMLQIWALERLSPLGKVQKNKCSKIDTYRIFGISESMEYIWGTFFSGEIIQLRPTATGSRVTSIFIAFVFIMIVAVYSANLIKSFVVVDETEFITGLKDPKIMDYNSKYKLGTQIATATANYLVQNPDKEVRRVSKKLIFYASYRDSINALKSREIDFFFSDYLSLRMTASLDKDCTFKVVEADSNFAGLGISFRKGSPWKRKLNLASVAIADSGEKDRLLKFWFGDSKCKTTNGFRPLGISNLENLFIWASCGICGCIIIMLIIYAWRGMITLYNIFKKANQPIESPTLSA